MRRKVNYGFNESVDKTEKNLREWAKSWRERQRYMAKMLSLVDDQIQDLKRRTR